MSGWLTLEEIQAIPRPQTEADYAACYRHNVVEARDELNRALEHFDRLKTAGQITESADAKGGYVFDGPMGKKAFGAVVKWRAELEHWHVRMVEAERRARIAAPDSRLPPEREPGDDTDTDVPW